MRIELRVERLVLEGVRLTFAERAQLAAVLETELGRALAAGGLGDSLIAGAAVPRLQGTAELGSGDPRVLAHSIATGVHEALGARRTAAR